MISFAQFVCTCSYEIFQLYNLQLNRSDCSRKWLKKLKEQMEPLMLAYPTAGPNFLIGANR